MLRVFLLTTFLSVKIAPIHSNNDIDVTKEIDHKIVGGQAAHAGQFPYQVSFKFFKDNSHFCGGAILNTLWIITAAHCFSSTTKASDIYVTVGATNLYDGVHHYISRFFPHPYFHLETVSYDIALATVKTPFTFTNEIQPISISDTYMRGGEDAIVTGWGSFYENGPISTTLQFVRVRVMTNHACINAYQYTSLASRVNNENLCTSVVKGRGFCGGDSGSPLVSNGELIGIVSWSPSECTYSGFPDVYTRVSVYREWIEDTIAFKEREIKRERRRKREN